MIICIIRHGQTAWNSKSLVQGITDNSLNELGVSQARNVGNYLKEHDQDWDVIISSPLKRATETAEIIKETLGIDKDLVLYDSLIERNFGEAEGSVLNKEMYNLLEKEEIAGLERIKVLETRSKNALLSLSKIYSGKKVLAVSHAQFIKSIITKLDPKFDFRSVLFNSSMNYFEVKDNKIKIIKYNIEAK